MTQSKHVLAWYCAGGHYVAVGEQRFGRIVPKRPKGWTCAACIERERMTPRPPTIGSTVRAIGDAASLEFTVAAYELQGLKSGDQRLRAMLEYSAGDGETACVFVDAQLLVDRAAADVPAPFASPSPETIHEP